MSSVASILLFLATVILLARGDLLPVGPSIAEPITDPENHPPMASGSIQEDPEDLWTNMTIRFSFEDFYYIYGEENPSFIWDFGDGSNQSTLAFPTHAYKEPGYYTVTLTVIDSNNVVDIANRILFIQRDYGETEVIIKALESGASKVFVDPSFDKIAPVAVKRDGWVAYMCDLKKGDRIDVRITVIGDRPADVYLFRHEDFLTYKNEPGSDELSNEREGCCNGITGEFRYEYRPQQKGRYYIVIDNTDRLNGTDTEGPVDYTIRIAPTFDTGPGPNYWWTFVAGPMLSMSIVLVAMVAVAALLRRRQQR